MSIFNRGTEYRLDDHEPEKPRKEREVRQYRPPRPLSWLSCGILIVLGAVLLFFGLTLLLLRYAGTQTEALANTRLAADGTVEQVEVLGMTTTISYTYRDAEGVLHGGTSSLFGNTQPVKDTIAVRYFPPIPGWNIPAFRTEDALTPFGSLFLGVILLVTAVSRLREIRAGREEE